MASIEAHGLRKVFGTTVALDNVDLRVKEGRILGLIGPNGAGKTTALNAILGLTSYEGNLTVLGRDPWNAREELMRDVSFIADVAVLPRWIRVTQLLDYVAGVHPKFDRAKAEGFLAKTTIKHTSKVRQLSKGMVAQLHLAVVMAIDAKLLVLDEPTLGLDILYRKQFYDSLLNDYFDRNRTIVVTTHQVEEIQDVLTDLMFINRGRIVLECSMEEFESRYVEVMVHPDHVAGARSLKPLHERQVFGRSVMLFENADRGQLAALGDVRTPSIADLFVAVMSNKAGETQPPLPTPHDRPEAARHVGREARAEDDRHALSLQTEPDARGDGDEEPPGNHLDRSPRCRAHHAVSPRYGGMLSLSGELPPVERADSGPCRQIRPRRRPRVRDARQVRSECRHRSHRAGHPIEQHLQRSRPRYRVDRIDDRMGHGAVSARTRDAP